MSRRRRRELRLAAQQPDASEAAYANAARRAWLAFIAMRGKAAPSDRHGRHTAAVSSRQAEARRMPDQALRGRAQASTGLFAT